MSQTIGEDEHVDRKVALAVSRLAADSKATSKPAAVSW